MARCCSEHSRAELLRRGIAEAGRGLPPIERGMPLPAGTGLSRRSFLARSAGLALAVYGGSSLGRLPFFEQGIAAAAAADGGKQRVLVSIFLEGGADSLSLLFPAGDPLYRSLRPHLGLADSAGQPFAEDERHPSLAGLATLHGEGKVTVLPGVGYTNANQSHFTSRHYWEVGATNERLNTGWMGRYLDIAGNPDNPLQGLSLDYSLQPALATARVPVASVDGPDRYDFWARGVWGEVEEKMLDAVGALGRLPVRGDAALATATGVARQSARLREQLLPFKPKDGQTDGFASPVAYPTGDEFPRRLAGLAAMIAAGLPLHCVALVAPGMYDTHDDQPNALSDALKPTADSLLAFQRDLEARGIADRVLVHVWSEFGRRAKENGSNGTDHGAAGTGFVIGSQASGRMIGEFPGLASLDEDGNLRATSDYRGLYCSLLEDWLGVDAARVIPDARSFARPAVVR